MAYLDLLTPRERNFKVLQEASHSQLLVCKGDLQQLIGVAESHHILYAAIDGSIYFAELPLETPLFVAAKLTLIELMRTMRLHRRTFVFVVNEFGVIEGIMTLDDATFLFT